MRRSVLAILVLMLIAVPTLAGAHPSPFSYLDLRVQAGAIDVTAVAHVFDVAHDLNLEPPERLLEPAVIASNNDAIVSLLASRVRLLVDGLQAQPVSWSPVEALPDRQSIRVRARYALETPPGLFSLNVHMFPYDAMHQTFVNVYEGSDLTRQAILDQQDPLLQYFTGSTQGRLAIIQRSAADGIRHALSGLDRWVFLLGLLLPVTSGKRIGAFLLACIAGHGLALVLTGLTAFHPSTSIVDAAVALSIVYVGADNLLVRGGRDMRVWIALAFGFIHGFWFGGGLREMTVSGGTFTWSLAAFNCGVELGQTLMFISAALAVASLRASRGAGRPRLALAGSAAVIGVGAIWFIQRTFFPGGFV